MKTVILIGFMGCGKTSLGQYAADRLGMAFVDTDSRIEEICGMPISRIFAERGEAWFRQLESEVLADCCRRGGMIVATGGGIVKDPRNAALVRENNGFLLYLRTDPEEIYHRLRDDNSRPLLNPYLGEAKLRRICELMDERKLLYEEAADDVFDEQGASMEEIGEELSVRIREIASESAKI